MTTVTLTRGRDRYEGDLVIDRVRTYDCGGGRGLRRYGKVIRTESDELEVHTSSRADAARLWLIVRTNQPRDGYSAMIELSPSQARQLGRALGTWLEDVG